jgi:hypothetical protein
MKPEPLSQCCNGCDAPPQPPSLVLCKACLEALSRKMEALAKNYESTPNPNTRNRQDEGREGKEPSDR